MPHPSQEALFPLESVLVTVIVFLCRTACAVALYIFEAFVKRLSKSGIYDAVIIRQKNPPHQSRLQQQQQQQKQFDDGGGGGGGSPTTKDTSLSSSFPQPSSYPDDTNSVNDNKNKYKPQDDEKKTEVAVEEDLSACMAEMIATGVLPYYLASESTNAMMAPKPAHHDPENEASSDVNTTTNNKTSHNKQTKSEDFPSSSSSSVTDTTLRLARTKKRITFGNEGSFYKVLREARPNATTTTSSSRSGAGVGGKGGKAHADDDERCDGIILIVGSSASDDVDAQCNAPVLGHIALQLADHCSVMGNVAVVACRVDFLSKPEPLSNAVDRLDQLCGEICANVFPHARGPLVILARNVTATLALHAVVRAARCATPLPVQTTPMYNNNNNGFLDDCRSSGGNYNFSSSSVGGGGGGGGPTVVVDPPSLRHASLLLFSPFVGWDTTLPPQQPSKSSASSSSNSSNNNTNNDNTTSGGGGGGGGGSGRITPQPLLSSSTMPSSWNTPERSFKSHDSYDNMEFLERFDDAASSSTGGGILRSPTRTGFPSNNNLQDESDDNDSSFGGAAADGSPSSSSSSVLSRLLQLPFKTTKKYWKLLSSSHLFRCRLRLVGSVTWTRMLDIAPTLFSPSLAKWFPATSVTFLYPSIKAMIVSDSAAPFSVETLHWARKLVSQGCAVRVVEWSSSNKDPHAEFTSRVTDTEGTAWMRDLLVDAGVVNPRSTTAILQHHGRNARGFVGGNTSSVNGRGGGVAADAAAAAASSSSAMFPDVPPAARLQYQHDDNDDAAAAAAVGERWETATNEFSIASGARRRSRDSDQQSDEHQTQKQQQQQQQQQPHGAAGVDDADSPISPSSAVEPAPSSSAGTGGGGNNNNDDTKHLLSATNNHSNKSQPQVRILFQQPTPVSRPTIKLPQHSNNSSNQDLSLLLAPKNTFRSNISTSIGTGATTTTVAQAEHQPHNNNNDNNNNNNNKDASSTAAVVVSASNSNSFSLHSPPKRDLTLSPAGRGDDVDADDDDDEEGESKHKKLEDCDSSSHGSSSSGGDQHQHQQRHRDGFVLQEGGTQKEQRHEDDKKHRGGSRLLRHVGSNESADLWSMTGSDFGHS